MSEPVGQIAEAKAKLEIKISEMKKKKANAKSALTKTRNKLSNLIESETPSRQAVRGLIDQVCSLQSKAIDIVHGLSKSYNEIGDMEQFQKTIKEMDEIECVCDAAVNKAQVFLDNTPSTVYTGSESSYLETSKSSSQKPSETSHVDSNASDHQHEDVKPNDVANVPQNKVDKTKQVDKTKKASPPSNKVSAKSKVEAAVKKHKIGEDMWKQLKRVSIPVFSGNVHQYEGWKAAFKACVDSAPATNEYKLLQLKQYLSGEAAQLVGKLGHTASAYDVALEKLDRKYGGSRRQIELKLEEVSNYKPLSPGNSKELDKFADMLDVLVVSLRDNDKMEELGNGCLYSTLRRKLTESMIIQYQRWVFEQQRQESVETLREWVVQETEFHTMASEARHGLGSKTRKDGSKSGSKSYFGLGRDSKCHMCQSADHGICSCTHFKSLGISARWDKIKSLKLCFRCLGDGHVGRECSKNVKCGIDGCKANHSKLLHGRASLKSESKSPTVQTTMSSSTQKSHIASLRTLPVVVRSGSRVLTVNALLDDASTQTYINEDVAAELRLEGESQNVSVNVLNSRTESFVSMSVDFELESLDGSVVLPVSALTTRKVTGKMPVVDWRKYNHLWEHLQDIPFPQSTSRKHVDLLIGMDYLMVHRSLKDVFGQPGEPIARLTPLGWTCVGNVAASVNRSHSQIYFSSNDSTLDELVQKFWEIEHIDTQKSPLTADDQGAVNGVEESTVYKNGRYEVGIPFKPNADCLEDNYDMALKRLISTEKKLKKDDVILQEYNNVIVDYVRKGYIRKVSTTEKTNTKWYLPHFPIVKMDRDTTKVRIVFDASAKQNGLSLNDVVYPGPKLQNDLLEILIRFREYPVAIVCDIAEMYMQIGISDADRPYFRFLWRTDVSQEPDVYEFSRVVFGLNSSPFLAQYVTQEHAKVHRQDFPLAAETVEKSTYMDDSMTSVENDEDAIQLCGELQQLFNVCGMHARKWVSNSKDVLDCIPIEDRLKMIDIQISDLPSVKALGLMWNAEKDVFTFSCKHHDHITQFTKRRFLSESAKLFDPLGLLAPFSIRGRILIQKMWLAGLDWDQPLSPDLEDEAQRWYNELEQLGSLSFPRCVSLADSTGDKELHVFVDASDSAYGAMVYLVHRTDTDVSSQLVAAKGCVASLKALSIPRMELLSAVLGVRLLDVVASAMRIAIHSVFWTDSLNVLYWIRNQSRNFKPFVAHRIGFIHEKTNPNQWKHVPGKLNPADVISRGAGLESLHSSDWLHGPQFLTKGEGHWPLQPNSVEQSEASEIRSTKFKTQVSLVTTVLDKDWRLDPSRYSSWTRYCRVSGWVYRFLNNSRTTSASRKTGELDVEEIQDAENRIISDTQKVDFALEYKAASEHKGLPTKSKILGLQPFVDDNGLLRCTGRLQLADSLSYDAKYPVILPRYSPVTRLIVKHYHEKCSHMGTNLVLSSLSSRFWIVSAREEIREWEKSCTWCQRKNTRPASQIMGSLPEIRVRCTMKAFEQTAVDFAGPFLTKQGRGKSRAKRYLCLFTCLSTRAVHLEMAFGLDTDSFLNAFLRMVNRRGMPKEMLSDNGTNFVGASNELKASLASKGVKWIFNPPHAPHFGGVFESLIKSAKRAIYAILSASDISDEELITAFTGAEALLNSRPLTYQTSHPSDDVPLTPNHFLHGQVGGDFAAELDSTSFNPRKRWRRIQELIGHFWRRWMREWLPTLNNRKKWRDERRDVKTGDVVVVVSADTPRGSWPLGKIVTTYPGKDGHVRVVDVQIGTSVFTRPVTKICPLEWSAE